jgi:hypothetical protein
MTIIQQAIFLPILREIKEKMVTSEVLGRFWKNRKPISYYNLLMVQIECVDMILHWDETDAIAETLWHFFRDELVPIYSLVEADRDRYVESDPIGVPESLLRCFAEARAKAKVLVAPQHQ